MFPHRGSFNSKRINMETRAKALAWWRGMTEEERKNIVKRHYPSLDFELFSLSSSKIERLYLIIHPNN